MPSASITGDDVERAIALALEQVEHDDHLELPRALLKRRDERAVERLGQRRHIAFSRALRVKPFEGELRVSRRGARPAAPPLERGETARDVGRLVPGRVLLYQRNLHRVSLPRPRRQRLRQIAAAMPDAPLFGRSARPSAVDTCRPAAASARNPGRTAIRDRRRTRAPRSPPAAGMVTLYTTPPESPTSVAEHVSRRVERDRRLGVARRELPARRRHGQLLGAHAHTPASRSAAASSRSG